jgi:Concanavalin A-like lectin/glucanases superfamily
VIRCPNGHENPDGSTYCSTCFITIDATAQPVEPEPEPTPEPQPEPEPTPEPQPEPTPEPQPEPTPEPEREPWPEPEPVVPEPTPPEPVVPTGLLVELEPQTSKGRTAGEHTLTVRNGGSVHVAGAPVVLSEQDELTFELEPATIAVAPGASASARLRAIPRKALWLGTERTHSFRVAVSPDAAADGAMVQESRIPAWLGVGVVLGVIAAAAIVGITSFLDGGGYRGEVLADAPVTYWRLNDGDGAVTAEDSSGNGFHGSYQGGARTAEGALDSDSDAAAAFNGQTRWVDIPDLDFPGDFTLEAWVRLSGDINSADAIVGQGGPGQDVNFYQERLRIFKTPAECTGDTIPGEPCHDTLVSNIEASSGDWAYWVITRSGAALTLYLDGEPVSAGAIPWTGVFTPKAIAWGNGGRLRGWLDEVAIYDHALDPSRIRAHFDAR